MRMFNGGIVLMCIVKERLVNVLVAARFWIRFAEFLEMRQVLETLYICRRSTSWRTVE